MKTLKTELLRTWNIAKWVLSIYFKNYPVYMSVFFVTELITSLANLVNAYIIALVTDQAIQLIQIKSLDITRFLPITLLIIGSYMFFELLRIINRHAWRMITYQDGFLLRKILAKRLEYLGIQNLENPEVSNKSQRFSEEVGNIGGFLEMAVIIVTGFVAFASAGVVLINTIPFVAILFTFVMIFQLMVNQKFIREMWVLNRDSTEDRRKNNTNLNLLSEPAPLKELILSQGIDYLTNKFNLYLEWMISKVSAIRTKWSVWQGISKILDGSVFGYGIIVILKRL